MNASATLSSQQNLVRISNRLASMQHDQKSLLPLFRIKVSSKYHFTILISSPTHTNNYDYNYNILHRAAKSNTYLSNQPHPQPRYNSLTIMSSQLQHQNQDHAGTCVGHCRAQRFALNYYCTEQYEKDKAAIKSYEDGWDPYDGPVWPWRHTNNPEAQAKLEDTWEGCCNTPPEQENTLGKLSHKIKPRIIANVLIATAVPTESETTRTPPTRRITPTNPKSPSLWRSATSSPCPTCGGNAVPCNL
ncbi:hypothetical protein K505DRAFT_113718 [Melanomma pulvis-pyrius CBS 109.77]|uniref:Uncharacterized protein n=1 Tax=Melanomma pulvis-pyrius CBS 109.77 TaxID=1314802 RepID=A0A6A6XW69_9PLEO|nr:hypothetical protein K505DRAFT_113718 [Melanomma pulvis-pyrius CBS 109.77]